MISNVEVRNSYGILLGNLPLAQRNSSIPYFIKDIEGLGPVKAEISYAETSISNGGVYQGARVGARNLVIKIGYRNKFKLSSGGSLAALRREVYKYFPPMQPVNLRFYNTIEGTVEINGYVEAVEPTIFSKDPEIQVSILCVKPYFQDIQDLVLTSNSAEGFDLSKAGSAPSGFHLKIHQTNDLRAIYNLYIKVGYQPQMYLGNGKLLPVGGILHFDTNEGSRNIYHMDGSKRTEMMTWVHKNYLSGFKQYVDRNSGNIRVNDTNINHAKDLMELVFRPKYIGL